MTNDEQHPHWVAIPNFVDTEVFRPAATEQEKRQCRERFGIPSDAFVVGCSAAVKKHHKRIDYLINEFVSFVDQMESQHPTPNTQHPTSNTQHPTSNTQHPTSNTQHPTSNAQHPTSNAQHPTSNAQHPTSSYLLIAGARQKDTDELIVMAKEMCGNRVRILTDVPREDMPDLYRCMDVMVLPSLFEMMPIAVLEALSSGLPVIANDHPVLRWMVGDRRTEDGGQRTEDGGQRTEDGGQRTEGGGQRTATDEPRTSDLGPPTSGASGAGGMCIDMSTDGALALTLREMAPEWVVVTGREARKHAIEQFSKERVIRSYISYYRKVLGEFCTMLDWDTEFFGLKIARVNTDRLDPESCGVVDAWCRQHGVACCYALLAGHDRESRESAVAAGFKQVDTRLTYRRDIPCESDGEREIEIRVAVVGDMQQVKALAREAHVNTRFWFDERFPRERCAAMYEVWVERAFSDPEEDLFVAIVDQSVAGYVSCQMDDEGAVRIGLIAVLPAVRRRGIGKALLARSLAWGHEHGSRAIIVSTQARNVGACRLYESFGFVVCEESVWYHKWF